MGLEFLSQGGSWTRAKAKSTVGALYQSFRTGQNNNNGPVVPNMRTYADLTGWRTKTATGALKAERENLARGEDISQAHPYYRRHRLQTADPTGKQIRRL